MLFFNFSTYFSPFSNYFISLYTRVFKIPYLYLDFYTRRFIYYLFPSLKPPPIPTIVTLSEDFYGKAKTNFLNAIESNNENKNANINSVFYNKKEYKQAIKEENNDLEKKWKSNILYKNTPRGNILMYYDAFKLGFVYTCDTSVSYDILNALAMKYVTEFRCLDFFVDNTSYEENKSPFIDLYFKEDADKEKNKEETTEEIKKKKDNDFIKENKDVFIKRAKAEPKKEQKKEEEKKEPEKEIIRNKFVSNGKMRNFSFLQKEKIEIPTNGFNSSWDDKLKKEHGLQKELFNYKDFKNMRK